MPNRSPRNRSGSSTAQPLPQPDTEDVRFAPAVMIKLAEYTAANGRDGELLSEPSPQVSTGKLKMKRVVLKMFLIEMPLGQEGELALEDRNQIRAVTSELMEARRRAG